VLRNIQPEINRITTLGRPQPLLCLNADAKGFPAAFRDERMQYRQSELVTGRKILDRAFAQKRHLPVLVILPAYVFVIIVH
jgi:hypothetical protein